MSWIEGAFLDLAEEIQVIIAICIVAVLGIKLGKIKLFSISLGITFVFFIGIIVGHLGFNLNKKILFFAQNAGLILFVYALGLQVGPGFFPSLRSSGLKLNILALFVIAIGLLLTVLFSFILNIPITNMVGVLCGAVTNTPALGAAQQALSSSIQDFDSKILTDMALATAVTYPLGVIGVILAIVFLKKTIKQQSEDNKVNTTIQDKAIFIGEFVVANPAIVGKTIADLMQLSSKKFVISRIKKKDKVLIAKSDTILELNDDLMVICAKNDVSVITALLGKFLDKDWNNLGIDWNKIDDSLLVSKKIIITQNSINGAKLGTLKLRNLYGVNVTRIERVGIQLLATSDLSLQLGDSLTVVGEQLEIDKVVSLLGDSDKQLNNPNLIAIFLGILLGLILGALPLNIPGISLPVKLGIAGGPIVVGILMGAFGPRFKITTYTTQSANLFMREFGLVIYLACLGIDAGEHFFETIMTFQGLTWIGLGIVLTVVPVILVGIFASKFYKLDFGSSIGMLSGVMTNPIALNFANAEIESDHPAIAYATVYPVSTFLRIITAQLLIIFFF